MNAKNVIGYFLIAAMLLSAAIAGSYQGKVPAEVYSPNALPGLYVWAIFNAPASMLIFCFWMIADAATNKKLKDKNLWVASLVVFNIIASLIYFFIHVRTAPGKAVKNQGDNGVT